jgi:hypothetical protein
MRNVSDIYPVTIVRARYRGGYEPGEWLAWPLYEDNLPPDWAGDDLPCRAFWETYSGIVGSGTTPQAAYDDLVSKASAD